MTNPWFRFYNDAIDDEKLRLLAFEDRWHYAAILCCKNSGLLNDKTDLGKRKIAVKLGLTVRELEEVARRLAEVGLIDQQTMEPLGWDRRQFQSDCSTERVKNWRKNNRLQTGNGGGTFQKRTSNAIRTQNTDTDTDKKPFSLFWQAYPKKVGKGAAETSWKKIRYPSETLPLILQAIENQKSGEQWQKNNGQFIPNPSTWLNQRRWEDEPVETISPKQGFPAASMSRGAQAQAILEEMNRRICDGEVDNGGDYQRPSKTALPAPSRQTGGRRNTEDHGNVVDVDFKEAREIDSGAS